ncbi:hypothetical protein FOA52_008597 [Chlamydomonas sp. UWO 241]|nr:hypothetical protein FOA52_008597 [Chlamydomonas sp. UWO 241]
MDEEEATAAAAERIAAAAEDGTSLPVRLATDVVRFLYGGTGRREPADGGVVSASLLNAKPAVGGIGVEPRGGGVLRALFTVASDAVADTVVRWRHELRRCVDSTAVFDVLSDREEAQHQALWPAFLAAKVAGKRAQFHRARLVVDGERAVADAAGALVVTPAEVRAAATHSKPGTAPGPDGIPVDVWRKLGEPAFELLAAVFTAVGATGGTPPGFLDGVVASIYKAKNAADAANYRPLTMLGSDYRILAKVLATRWTPLLSALVGPEQTAFLAGRRISDNICLTQMLPGLLAANAADGVGPTGAALALLDFRKAYDTIDRGFLIAVMEAVGVGDGVLAWTRTILTHTYASAEVNGFISAPRKYAAGVRQGCPAAPALFLFLGHALACFLRTCPAALGPVARITGRVQTAELWGAEAPLWANPLLQLELPAAQRSVQWREPTGDAAGHALFSPTDAARWLVDGLARVRDALPGMRTVTDLCVLWAWLAAVDMVFAGLRGLEAAVPTLWRMPLLNARKEPIWRLWPPARSVAVERAGKLATMDLWDALASFAEGGGMPRGSEIMCDDEASASYALIAQLLAAEPRYGYGYDDDEAEEPGSSDTSFDAGSRKRPKGAGGGKKRGVAPGKAPQLAPVQQQQQQEHAEASAGPGGRKQRSDVGRARAAGRPWTDQEECAFLRGLEEHGRDWRAVAAAVVSRNPEAVKSHAQRHFIKLAMAGQGLPAKVAESGPGYTLSGGLLDPGSAGATQNGFRVELLAELSLEELSTVKAGLVVAKLPRELGGEGADADAGAAHDNDADNDADDEHQPPAAPVPAPVPAPAPAPAPAAPKRRRQSKGAAAKGAAAAVAAAAAAAAGAAAAAAGAAAAPVAAPGARAASAAAHERAPAGGASGARPAGSSPQPGVHVGGGSGGGGGSPAGGARSDAAAAAAAAAAATAAAAAAAAAACPPSRTEYALSRPQRNRSRAQALLVADLQAHLCSDEIIGLLGGSWDAVTQVRSMMEARGQRCVGWYHSHPVFEPNPSQKDMENQRNYQALFRDPACHQEPFVGLIVGPYNVSLPGPASAVTAFLVQQRSSMLVPYSLRYSLTGTSTPPSADSFRPKLSLLADMLAGSCTPEGPPLTRLAKLRASLARHLSGAEPLAVRVLLELVETELGGGCESGGGQQGGCGGDAGADDGEAA